MEGGRVERSGWMGGEWRVKGGGWVVGGENKSGGRTVSFIYNNVYEMAYSVLSA